MVEEVKISAAAQLATELRHEGRSQYVGLLFPVPTRLTLDVYSMVEALTQRAGTSRNKLMNQLVEAGIEAVLAELDPVVVMDLRDQADRTVSVALERNAGVLERGEI
jgi:hypothetical protein